MRSGLYALLALPACYAPTIAGGVPCEPSAASCPTGQTCQASGDGYVCSTADAGGDIDAGIDGAPPDGAFCLGDHLVGSICLSRAPTAPVTLSSATPINSAVIAPGGCTELRPQAGGPALCIISGTTITVPVSATLRAFSVVTDGGTTATNPLVLIASQSISIEGAIDVASHVDASIATMPVLGAGARTAVGCAAIGVDGTQGRLSGQGDSFGGGGAAGGSLGSLGGAGGFGGSSNNVAHGNPVAGTDPTLLVGGCPGGRGGDGEGDGGGGGTGGGGGGAVYLLAGDSIAIAGKINASGAGGGQGKPGMFSAGGGGGGGSGGVIGLEAPRIMLTGTLFANGGGGASGSGGNDVDTGASGSDPTSAAVAAPGAAGNDGGGAGGAGSVGAGTGAAARNGSMFRESAGGGGGGGAGMIRVFGVPPSSVTGAISPPAT
jgi:hypothetical protein